MIKSLERLCLLFIVQTWLIIQTVKSQPSFSLNSINTTTINANATYTFSIADAQLQAKNGTIRIGFQSSLYSLSGLTCYNTETNQPMTCTVIGGTQVQVTINQGAFPTANIGISISTIKNPSSKQGLNFNYTFSSGGTNFSNTSINNLDILTPDILNNCSVSFSPSTVFSDATAIFSFTIRNALNQNSTITVIFPNTWNHAVSSAYTPLISSMIICSKVSGTGLSNILNCGIFQQKFQVLAAFSSAVTGGSSFVFNASIIKSPPTTFSGNTITMITSNSNGYTVDQSTCSVLAVSQQQLSLFLASTSTFLVGASSSLSLFWFTGSPIRTGDVFTITLPNSYMQFTIFTTVVLGYSDSKLTSRSLSNGTSNLQQKITINSLSSGDSQISSNIKISLSNFFVNLLIDTSPRSVNIIVSRSGFNIASGSISLTPTANLLSNVSITSDISIVSSPMALTFNFITTNPLNISSYITIQIPSSIQLTGSSPTCLVTSSTHSSSILSTNNCTLTSYTIRITNFLGFPLPVASAITIVISNALKNPITTQTTSKFLISTMSSANFKIDQNTQIIYKATPGTIGNITISSSSTQVANPSLYILDYTILRSIKAGSTISVTLPPEVALSSTPSYTYSINYGSFFATSPTVTTVNGTTTLSFTGLIVSQLNAANNLRIRFNITNPNSISTSSSFNVIVSFAGLPTQTLSAGLTITTTIMAAFVQVIPLVSSPMNGATKDYTFYIKPFVSIPINSLIKIQILDATNGTNQISFTNTIICPIYFGTTTLTNICTVSGNLVTIAVEGDISDTSGATQYRMVISSMILARTPKISSNFRITSFTPSGAGVQTMTVSSLVNTQSNSLQSLSLAILTPPSQLNSLQQLKLIFTTFNGLDLLNGQYFVIDIPTSFTYYGTNTSILCTNMIFNCSKHNGNSNAIKVTASTSYSTSGMVNTFTVTLTDLIFVSPTSFLLINDYFYVTTYTNNHLIIDKTDPINVVASRATFFLTCSARCRTCLSLNSSVCSSCYIDNTGVIPNITYGGFSIMTSDSQCVDVCGNGFFLASGNCTQCASPCQTCSALNQCNSCVSGFYYISTNIITDRCKSICPDAYFANTVSRTCDLCSSSCFKCNVSSNLCTACNGTSYLSGTQCIPLCPDGTFENTLSNICSSCDVGCLSTCGVSQFDCIACKPGYLRQSTTSTKCVNTCPFGSVNISSNGICGCSSSCLTCSGTATACLTCIPSSPILYQTSCLIQCPSQTYQPVNLSICVPCHQSSCSICNSTTCTRCVQNFFLSSIGCVSNCPLGTYASAFPIPTCINCPAGCLTCTSSTICSSCQLTYLIQLSSCVQSCGATFVNFNATRCESQCPLGYFNNNGRCEENPADNNTNSNTANETVNTTQSIGRIVPFPYTITYVLVIGVSIGMRCLYPHTLLPSVLMSFGSILQIMSAITLIIVSFVGLGGFTTGLVVLIAGVGLVYLSNFVSLLFIIKVLHNDNKFVTNYRKKVCPNNVVRVISVIFYHKFHQIVFSNIFGVKLFCNKVDYIRRLYPFNVLLIISIFLSVVQVVGASLISYQVQQSLLSSSTFIQSVDCIVIVVLNVIPTVLVLRRKDTLYEQQIDDKEAKRYETQDQLNMNNDSVGIQQIFIQESGDAYGKPNKVGQSRKNYYYQNSKRSQNGQDPYQTPLDKKRTANANPITGTGNQTGQRSSQSLFFGDKSKVKSKMIQKVDEQSDQIQQIVLQQPARDNLLPSRRYNGNKGNKQQQTNAMINYTGYDLEPHLLKLNENSDQFKKLPSQIKAKIRLAKANIQINKNSSKINKSLEPGDLQQINLSPKKNKIDEQNAIDTSGAQLLNQSMKKARSSDKNKSKSKSKSKDKKKNTSKSKQKNKSKNNKDSDDKDQVQQARIMRNNSQQMNKKQLDQVNNGLKSTKSQNIKKKKKKPNNQIKVLFNGAPNIQGQENQQKINDDFDEQDQPNLPIFKHKSKSPGKKDQVNIYSETQAFGDQFQSKKKGKRISQNFEDKNLNNLRVAKGQRTIPNQQPDQLPKLHSSQQLGNLIVINKKLTKKRSGQLQFSNDDSSIYKKIYNDDDETLKSVQGDNFFGHDVSPSQFNVQNQRFQQTQASRDNMPVLPSFDIDQQLDEKNNNDGLDQQGKSHLRRYQSSHNIDYDSVLPKRINNDRIKQLQKIYLPRLQVMKPKKKK